MHHRYIIRPASVARQDATRILDFTDSQIEYLARIGSGEQWGTAADKSASLAAQAKYRDIVRRSEEGEEEEGDHQAWGPEWLKAVMLDVEVEVHDGADFSNDDGPGRSSFLDDDEGRRKRKRTVAAMILEGRSSEYTRGVLPEQDERDPFVYVRYLVTDRRAGVLGKGSGRRLLDYADEVARGLGFGRVCLDGWSGNGGLLVGYYEKLGFVRLGDVVDGPDWPATVLERRVER